MSSVRGGTSRGRDRGSTQQPAARGRGVSTTRSSGFNNQSTRGNGATRGTFGQASRGNATRPPRGSTAPRANASTAQTTVPSSPFGRAKPTGTPGDRFQALTKARERERADAIQRGLIADPEKPRALADAITPVGTCQEMCPEYERVQRIVQNDVWHEETDPNHSPYATTEKPPDESRMVKKFRRSAAGLEEQLPSDLRPPAILKRTCDYLLDEMIGKARALGDVHHFVWDRTRAIRNDFSIQQVQKREELLIAVECYERIARFHIMSLHQLALPEKPYSKYDWQQEREQLDRTLLSLMQLYDDSRERVPLPNEAEFRAYCVILQLQDPTPDLEDRIQSWPRHILQDRRVQKAIEVYMAACNIMDPQGPLKPLAHQLIARQDWQKFWALVASKEVSYLMACAAEVYFNLVRRMVLNAIYRTSWQVNSKKRDAVMTSEWTVELLCDLLAFDEYEEVYKYCEHFGFSFQDLPNGQNHLDLRSVSGPTLPTPTAGIPKQSKSHLVEYKRFGRTLPAVINGLTVKQAQDAGMVIEQEDEGEEMEMEDANNLGSQQDGMTDEQGTGDSIDDGESLFIPEQKPSTIFQFQTSSTQPSGLGETVTASNPFSGLGTGSGFGKPSGFRDNSPSLTGPRSTQPQQPTTSAPKFDFLQASKPSTTTTNSPFNFLGTSKLAELNTTTENKPASPSTSTFAQMPRQAESVFSKPAALPATTAPPSFSTSPTRATALGDNLSPKSNAAPLFPTAAPTSPSGAKIEASESRASKTQFGFAQPATPAAPLPRQPSSSPEIKSSQPHFTTTPQQPTSTSNPQLTTPGSNLGTRKLSSSRDHRPDKPSPLSYSFTAGDDSSAIVDGHPPENLAKRPLPQGPFPTQHSRPRTGDQSSISQPSGESLNAIVARVADEFYTEPTRGILKQYIDFHVRQTVREVKDQIETEQLNEEAARYNIFRLHTKYGRRWKDLFWKKRLAKSGRERRERRRRRLEQRSSQEFGGSMLDASTDGLHSQSPSVAGAEDFDVRPSVEVDGYGRPLNYQRMAHSTKPTEQAHAGMKRPMSSHRSEDFIQSRQYAHKRMKSTSHIDDRGAVAKPYPTSHPNSDILKRSAFLGFTSDSAGPIKNTTRSSYFRLKALGVRRADEAAAPRGTKRRLSASVHETTETSPPALRPSSSLSRYSATNDRAMMPPPSVTPSLQATANKDDDELFARLKAAREHLTDSTTFYKGEVNKDEAFRRSLKSSVSSNEYESPSMARARSEARMRASQASPNDGASTSRSNVPAYRLRESRFVPRENYKKAIEQAREMRESRSRDTSRPESPKMHGALQTEVQESALSFNLSNPTFSSSNLATSSINGLNGLSHKQPEPTGRSAFAPGSTSISLTNRPPISFANHKTDMSAENPFLKSQSGNAFPGFIPQETTASQAKTERNGGPKIFTFADRDTKKPSDNPFLKARENNSFSGFAPQQTSSVKDKLESDSGPQDFTVQPSQINEALANSWGSSHGYGINKHLSIPHDMETPPQQDSYLGSQTISLISDDEDETPQSTQRTQVDIAVDTEATEELVEESEEDETNEMNGHFNPYELRTQQDMDECDDTEEDEHVTEKAQTNPYARLAHQDMDEDQESYDSQMGDDEGYDEEEYDNRIPNGYAGVEDEDEEGIDGDIDDDETEEDGDEEDAHGYDEYSEDEGGETQQAYYAQQRYDARWASQPQKNDALAGVGNTAEEAIELSD